MKNQEKVKLVIFTLLGEFYAFFGRDVKEILSFSELTYVPGTPDFIPGIINVRGDIESVLDIRKLMGLSATRQSSKSRIIIAENSGTRSGILADSVIDVLDHPLKLIHPPTPYFHKTIEEFVCGETTCDEQRILILEVGKIFKKMTF